ncbi:hypothetical protein MMC30_001416 [Trapelia coarctata]|nr:hypothetical protein [Trapelia coarctata]
MSVIRGRAFAAVRTHRERCRRRGYHGTAWDHPSAGTRQVKLDMQRLLRTQGLSPRGTGRLSVYKHLALLKTQSHSIDPDMPSKWTPEDDLKLMLTVIKESGYKPKWDTIQAAMGPKFTAEGIRQHYAQLMKRQPTSNAGTSSAAGAAAQAGPSRPKATTTGTPTKKRKTGAKSSKAKTPEDSDPEESIEYDEEDDDEDDEDGDVKGKGKAKKEEKQVGRLTSWMISTNEIS